MLRNPVSQAVSMHAQRLLNSHEDVPDFGTAWRLQSERREGRHLPKECRDRKILLYRDIANYPEQIERLFRHASRSQVLVILFDEFAADTGKVYDEVLDFLGLPSEGREQFEKVNQRQANRNVSLARWLSNPPPALMKLAQDLKRITGISRLGVIDRLRSMNTDSEPEKAAMEAEVQAELAAVFREDTLALQELIGRDLSDWL
jgi:hypothetical protein